MPWVSTRLSSKLAFLHSSAGAGSSTSFFLCQHLPDRRREKGWRREKGPAPCWFSSPGSATSPWQRQLLPRAAEASSQFFPHLQKQPRYSLLRGLGLPGRACLPGTLSLHLWAGGRVGWVGGAPSPGPHHHSTSRLHLHAGVRLLGPRGALMSSFAFLIKNALRPYTQF